MDKKKHFYRMGNHSGGWDDLPVDSDEMDALINSARKHIEPWLSAVFQAEHLNLLLGSAIDPDYIEHTIDELEALKPDIVIPMNCTGANFIASMLRRMPERIVASNSWQPVDVRQIIQRPVL